jgi:asparagine synthase (glutamine-hydrolysing)
VRIQQYANVADRFAPWTGTKHQFFDEIAEAFCGAVERGFSGDHAYGLALSGGLDSRAILSAVNGRASTLTTYTLGVDGCADQVIAERLSCLTGTKHAFFELDDGYLSDFLPNLERMVSLTDGMYLSHGLTEMLALKFLDETGIEVLLRGHGGELAKTSTAWPFHTDARVHAMRDRRELPAYLFQRINYISGDLDLRSLFTSEWVQEMLERPRASLQEAIQDIDLTPPNLCTYLYITEHHRRSSIPSLELFRTALDVRLPFFDSRFMALLLQAPAEWRDGVEIHRALMSRGNARLLKVRNSNTGARGDAGPLVEMALDKLNTILRRLNVYGYRHYHQFDAWMQAQLLKHVEAVVLERRALERGIFREDALRQLIEETKSGAKDRSFLLLVLLIVELWQRQNL